MIVGIRYCSAPSSAATPSTRRRSCRANAGSSRPAGIDRKGLRDMTRRILLLFVFLLAVAQLASAQSPQAALSSTDSRHEPAKDVRIVLEMRWLALNQDAYEGAIRLGAEEWKLPGMGALAVPDKQHAEALLTLVSGDRRSNLGPTQRLIVLDGQKRELSPPGAIQGGDAVLATVSDDRQTIQIQLTWPKQKDGTESLPVTTAAVPLGSYLLVHSTEFVISGPMTPVSSWQKFQDRLLHQQRATSWREKQQLFLLVSPRIARPGEKEEQRAAK